ncbi:MULTISPECIES: hypothetical protein [Mycobacteriaceae]|uniref:hypothetical protein n=1 Tax=Mycobacteriaceae TaxID=1762 RepID=UPI0032D573E7
MRVHHDPVDHYRTTSPHAGEALKNVRAWPGLLLVAMALVATAVALAAAAYMQAGEAAVSAIAATGLGAVGYGWIRAEQAHVRRVELQWLADHYVA